MMIKFLNLQFIEMTLHKSFFLPLIEKKNTLSQGKLK